jgi:AraC-like DNA-binding protein
MSLYSKQLAELFTNRYKQFPRQIDIEVFIKSVASFFCYHSSLQPQTIDVFDYEWLVSKVAVSKSPVECFTLFNDALCTILNLSANEYLSSDCFVAQICEYFERNFKNQINIDSVAKEHFITAEHLIRTFKKHTGETPLQYIINKRLESAKTLLKIKPALDVKQIAEMVGYENPNYFSRIFKCNTNMTPSEYRQTLKPE